jgi:hypothetical protein
VRSRLLLVLAVAPVVLPACGDPASTAVPRRASTTAVAETTTSANPKPDDGRLHRLYATAEYQPGSPSMGSWRMDPAPADARPHLSQSEALALFRASDGGRFAGGSNTIVRFGLFTGNAPNPNTPDGHLTGSHPIGAVPAWIIVVEGLELMPSGGAGTPGSPPRTQTTVAGYALTVLSDEDGHNLTGWYETGGTAASTGIG